MIDRAGPFQALEHHFEVRSDVPGALDVVTRLFAGFASAASNERRIVYKLRRPTADPNYEIFTDGELLHAGIDAGSLVDWLIFDVGRRAYASSHPFVVLHAGVVSLNGRGIILPAPQEHGKSTLTTALVRAGFGFLSDEAAPIDPRTGTVEPFPRPILLSPRSLALFPGMAEGLPGEYERFRNYRYHLTGEDVRIGSHAGSCPIDLIVAPRYEPHAATELESLSAADCLRLLLDQCLNPYRIEGQAIQALANVVEGSRRFRLTTSDVPAAVEEIFRLADAARRP